MSTEVTHKIAIFASGTGTNAENIINYFSDTEDVSVDLVLCNKAGAGVIDRAEKLGVRVIVFNRDDLYENGSVLNELKASGITFVVLAGFLWLMPTDIVREFPDRMINIHPALLPKYGGKGMYGDNVHRSVKENMDTETGITIHYVNEKYDEGNIVFQAKCDIDPLKDDIENIAAKVHQLEYKHYPEVINKILKS